MRIHLKHAIQLSSTLKDSIPEIVFSRHDIVVFGFPVYAGRILPEALDRLNSFHGNHTPCVITVTYGNRHYDDALLELFNNIKERGFINFTYRINRTFLSTHSTLIT